MAGRSLTSYGVPQAADLSTAGIFPQNLSLLEPFLDTSFRHVHGVDISIKLDAAIAANLKELGYGG